MVVRPVLSGDPRAQPLERAQGQLGAVVRTLGESRGCEDVVTQLSAVPETLDRAGFAVVTSGPEQCPTGREGNLDKKDLEKPFPSHAHHEATRAGAGPPPVRPPGRPARSAAPRPR